MILNFIIEQQDYPFSVKYVTTELEHIHCPLCYMLCARLDRIFFGWCSELLLDMVVDCIIEAEVIKWYLIV